MGGREAQGERKHLRTTAVVLLYTLWSVKYFLHDART